MSRLCECGCGETPQAGRIFASRRCCGRSAAQSRWREKREATRAAILAVLEMYDPLPLTTEDLSDEAGYSLDTIRRHIRTLVKEGSLKRTRQPREGQRGGVSLLYRLRTEAAHD